MGTVYQRKFDSENNSRVNAFRKKIQWTYTIVCFQIHCNKTSQNNSNIGFAWRTATFKNFKVCLSYGHLKQNYEALSWQLILFELRSFQKNIFADIGIIFYFR